MQDMAGSRSAVTTSSNIAATSEVSTSASHTFPTGTWDPDFDTEPDPPDWRESISTDDLNKLGPRERKRQDVINGTYTYISFEYILKKSKKCQICKKDILTFLLQIEKYLQD